MAKSRDANKEAVMRRLRARLDRRSRGADAEADAQLRAQVDFYIRMHTALFANSGSTNVDAVDAVAVAVLADDALLPVELLETVTLLPLPDSLHVVAAPPHDLFTVPTPPARSSGKRPTTRSASKPPPSKKQRKSKAAAHDDDADDGDADDDDDGTEAYEFPLPASCPAAIRRDINKIIKQADAQGKTPPRMAYPWVGQRAWYDPQEHPALHLAHWRFWMHWRDVFFFACALYAPSDECTACRKKKSNAGQARLVFVSLNIIDFGFYGFLDVFENATHDNLMWLGGKAARRSTAAKAKGASDTTVATDLGTLYRTERGRYDSIIARALDPYRVDEDGYQSISDLLEQTDALNPTKAAHLRLSDEALARVVIDVTSGNPPNPSWVGNKSAGTWKILLGDARIRALTKKLAPLVKKGKQPFPAQKPYNEDKEQCDDYSDFEDDKDMFTVLPPTPPLDEEDDGEPEELDEKLPEAEADQDQEEDAEQEQDDPEDDEERSSGANTEPTDDDKKSSAGDEGDGTTSKKKSASATSSKSK